MRFDISRGNSSYNFIENLGIKEKQVDGYLRKFYDKFTLTG